MWAQVAQAAQAVAAVHKAQAHQLTNRIVKVQHVSLAAIPHRHATNMHQTKTVVMLYQ